MDLETAPRHELIAEILRLRARVQKLLEANNREVERRRQAEGAV